MLCHRQPEAVLAAPGVSNFAGRELGARPGLVLRATLCLLSDAHQRHHLHGGFSRQWVHGPDPKV